MNTLLGYTLHYTTLHYITLHYTTLLHYITLHYTTYYMSTPSVYSVDNLVGQGRGEEDEGINAC